MINIKELKETLKSLEFDTKCTYQIKHGMDYISVLTEEGIDEFLTRIYNQDNSDLVVAAENYFDCGFGCKDEGTIIANDLTTKFKLYPAINFIEDWVYENS